MLAKAKQNVYSTHLCTAVIIHTALSRYINRPAAIQAHWAHWVAAAASDWNESFFGVESF